MKSSSVRQFSLAVGLAFFIGCARPSAQPEQAKPIVSPVTPVVAAADVAAAAGAPDKAAAPAPVDTNAPAILERIPPATQPENVTASSGINEVAKLAQAGVSEQVMLAYVDKYDGRFNVNADQIVYLNDLGVPSTVITAMVKHDGKEPAPATAQAAPVAPPPQPVPTATAPAAANVPPPSSSTEVSYFYDSLSPYGSWIYITGYGWCWQPTVAVSVSTWRPYCDNGSWYWSDGGWYWHSDYSWGWAPFHYGRWYYHGGCGWVWTPGLAWGPSWVSWRYYDGYCGWAPLPPEARYVHGVGFTYYGSHVSVGFEFGLTSFHYSFVHVNRFCDPAPYRHVIARPTVVNIYKNTTVVNNYVVGNNNTVINRGVGRETIARSSNTRVREVAVRETPMSNLSAGRAQKVERQGNQFVAYRPQLPKTPPPVRTAPNVSRGSAVTAKPAPGVGNARPEAVGSRPPTGTGSGKVTPGEPRRATPATPGQGTGRGTERIERNNERPATPATRQPQQQPRQEPATRPQPRTENPLFGNTPSGRRTEQPANNNPAGQGQTRVVTPVQPATPSVPRTTPQNPVAPRQQVAPRTELPNNPAPARVAPNNPYQSPRQYEQGPRYSQPSGGRAEQQYNRPNPAPERSGGTVQPRGNSGGGRIERSERGDRNR